MANFRKLIVMGLGLQSTIGAGLQPRTYKTHDVFALHIDEQISPEEIAYELGIKYLGQIGELSGHHVFSYHRNHETDVESLLLRHQNVAWAIKLNEGTSLHRRIPPPYHHMSESLLLGQPDPHAIQVQEHVASVLGISDPTFRYQWHLLNTLQPGNDLNVTGVWLDGVTGEGITTAVIDDGLDIDSLDLKPNYYANGSYDFNDDVPEPRPRLLDDHHGTLCAAEIAAAKNNICGIGVAYRSRVSGIRMLSGTVDDVDQAAALNFDYQNNDIYSCSWGPTDDGRTMKAPGLLVQRAIANGVQRGRGGKGSIFVFSAGNGASEDDNCNFDGYTNSIFSITVGAVDRTGTHAVYSESCSAQLVVAYSSGLGHGIYTTDNGDRCTALHSGTSAAGPLAAATVALALSVRPDLSWRDVQYLLVETAVPVHEEDGSWQVGAETRMFSHDWGYGKVDAYSLVQKARGWNLVNPQAWFHSPWQQVDVDIPEGHEGLVSSYTITADMMRHANVAQLEHVTVTMNVHHTRRGDLSVDLISPRGMVSHLSTPRMPDDHQAGYVDWEFMSVAHWGEAGIGTWRILVKDTNVNGYRGTFVNWRLNLWGEAIDGSSQNLHPLPGAADPYGTEAATMTSSAQTHAVLVDPTISVTPVIKLPEVKTAAVEPSAYKIKNLAVQVIILGFAVSLALIVLFAYNYFRWAKLRHSVIDPEGKRPLIQRIGSSDVSESASTSQERNSFPRDLA